MGLTLDSVEPERASSAVILQQWFGDVDELAEALNIRRQVQIDQLSFQSSQSQVLLAKFDQIQFLLFEVGCPLQIMGPKDPNFIEFACIFQPGQAGLVAHDVEVTPETVFGFDPNREISLILPDGLKLAGIQISQSAFYDYLQLMHRSDIDHRYLAQNYLRSPVVHGIISDYLRELFWLALNQTGFLQQPHLPRLILEDFLPLLIDALPVAQAPQFRSLPCLRRAQLVQQAETYMREHLDQAVTLKDLCIVLSTSSRALNYGFQDVFGISPMAYLKLLRLHGLRRALKLANPETMTIGDLAAQFGFWSLGHLSRDYQTLFGEKLSNTLNPSSLERKA